MNTGKRPDDLFTPNELLHLRPEVLISLNDALDPSWHGDHPNEEENARQLNRVLSGSNIRSTRRIVTAMGGLVTEKPDDADLLRNGDITVVYV